MLAFAVALATGVATARAAGDGLPSIGGYFSNAELQAAHPRLPGAIYHGLDHSVQVRAATFELARARGHDPATARFLSEVALVHDWDPDRPPGMPARVDATLALLEADYAGQGALVRGARGSILKDRFKWTPVQLRTALALIQRTAYPFDPAAAIRYERTLRTLPPAERGFALAEGALLSEYADKGSTYMRTSFRAATSSVAGLAGEISRANAAAGRPPVSVRALTTVKFLDGLGQADAFVHDRAIAKRLGVDVRFLGRDEVFAKLPAWGRTFKTNHHGFRVLARHLAAGLGERQAITASRRALLRPPAPPVRRAGPTAPRR